MQQWAAEGNDSVVGDRGLTCICRTGRDDPRCREPVL